MFMPEAREKGFEMPSFMFMLPFSVPAILYCINNNFAVHMQLHMDPVTYQVRISLNISKIKNKLTNMRQIISTHEGRFAFIKKPNLKYT